MNDPTDLISDPLTDMHCHLDFATNSLRIASRLEEAGVAAFSNTITPHDWKRCSEELSAYPNIVVGFGWHPWWVATNPLLEAETDHDIPCALASRTEANATQWSDALQIADMLQEQLNEIKPRALGEIGLDFGDQNYATKDLQLAIFETFAKWAASSADCLLSIHAIEAAAQTLEILENAHVLSNCPCIFHWFSGSSLDLNRALKDGCYFSVNTRMLKSRKGREYVRQIPVERLLLESDLPSKPRTDLKANDLIDDLSLVVQEINQIKGTDCTTRIDKTAKELLRVARD